MELNITKFFRTAAPSDYSASRMELGDNAGPITWRAAVEAFEEYPLLDTDDKRAAFRAFAAGFGAWSTDEIAAWSDAELNALCVQFVAGDIREAGLDTDAPDWTEYEADAQRGHHSGRLFTARGEVFYTLG